MASLADIRAQYPQYSDLSDTELLNGLHAKFYADMPKGEFFDKVGVLDKTSGAPATVRMAVGGAPDKDRLAQLKRYYPDAEPYGDDNFVFTDPKTGKPTVYNPKGFDLAGDTASVAREITQSVGGALGATAGAVSSLAAGPAAPLAVGPATVAGAGAGTAIADSLFDIARVISRKVDTRGPIEKVTDVATAGVMGAAGQKAGDLMGIALQKVAGAGRPAAQQMGQDLRSLGIEGTAGVVSGSKPVQGMERMLENAPGSSAMMQRLNERVTEQVKAAAQGVADKFGPTLTPEGAGEVIKAGAKKAGERFTTRQQDLYDQAFNKVGDITVAPQGVTALRETLEARLAAAPESLSKSLGPAIETLKRVEADAAKAGGVPFAALREIRTAIGRDLDAPMLAGSTGAQNSALREVYGALTEDMKAAAASAGDDAAKALATADRYTRFNMNQSLPILQKLADTEADEQAFRYAMATAKDGGTRLAKLRKSLTAEEWDAVAGTVLGRMGLAKPGAQDATGEAFSASTFLTNWQSLSPEAKRALFSGTRYKEMAPELDKLVRVMGALKDAGKEGNPSGTARQLMAFTTIGTLGGALGLLATGDISGAATGVGATILAPAAAAKLLTNPKFVKWLADAGPQSLKPNGLTQHMGRLTGIAAAEPQIKEEIGQFVSAFRQ